MSLKDLTRATRACLSCGHPEYTHKRSLGFESTQVTTNEACRVGWVLDVTETQVEPTWGACYCAVFRPRTVPVWWPLIALWLFLVGGSFFTIWRLATT